MPFLGSLKGVSIEDDVAFWVEAGVEVEEYLRFLGCASIVRRPEQLLHIYALAGTDTGLLERIFDIDFIIVVGKVAWVTC